MRGACIRSHKVGLSENDSKRQTGKRVLLQRTSNRVIGREIWHSNCAADAGHVSARNALRHLEGERKDCDRLNVEDEEETDIISPLTTFDSCHTYLRKTSVDSGFEIAGETVTTTT